MTDALQLQKMMQNLQNQMKMVEAYAKPYTNLLNTPQLGVTPGMDSGLTSQTQDTKQDNEQLSTFEQIQKLPLSNQQELLLKMYDEFANTDDGKAFSASLNKFARFVQSKVAKAS